MAGPGASGAPAADRSRPPAEIGRARPPTARVQAWLRHLLCVAALMWVAIVNGQPFFFPDTTAYVRAGDLAAYLASSGRFTTVWTARYAAGVQPHAAGRAPQQRSSSGTPADAGANDLKSGSIMSGRSPFFGVLLYLGWVTSRFWLFVIGQAVASYALIVLSLRHFGLGRSWQVVTTVLALAALTSLPFFNALLLADALASFGILAFLLLATSRGPLRRGEAAFLWLTLVGFVVSHLTHVAMLGGMVAMLGLLRLTGRATWLPRRAWWAGGIGLAAGLGAIILTSTAVRFAFDKPPKLVPLMTARFIADGPGLRFVRAGCDGNRFAVCERPLPDHPNGQLLLWSHDPAEGFFMSAPPARRDRIAGEDTAFALAVLRAYPLAEGFAMARNTVVQLVTFEQGGLNTNCFPGSECWAALPPSVRSALAASPSGRNLWPAALMTEILYVTVALSLLVIAVRLPALIRLAPPLGRELALWMAVGATAMVVCAVLGGAISEPQYRYQGRLIWLVPFFAAVTLLLDRRMRRGETRS